MAIMWRRLGVAAAVLALPACDSDTEGRLTDRTWEVTHLTSEITRLAGLQPAGTIELDDAGRYYLGPTTGTVSGDGWVDLVIETEVDDAIVYVPWTSRLHYNAGGDGHIRIEYAGAPRPDEIDWVDNGDGTLTWTSQLELPPFRIDRTYTVQEAP